MQLVCHNGRFVDARAPLLEAANPAFRWGEGLFETMKLLTGRICLAERHWSRLYAGLRLLELNDAALQAPVLQNLLPELALRNGCADAARLRLTVFREGGGLGFIAEAVPLPADDLHWNNRGWQLGLYPGARIACDEYAQLKSVGYLPYLRAARYAEAQELDECCLLNAHGRICETARMNLFLVRDGRVLTPPLEEGCIAGVMRTHLIDLLQKQGVPVSEEPLHTDDLLQADEVFLTNALKGIRWVACFGDRQYESAWSRRFYDWLQATF